MIWIKGRLFFHNLDGNLTNKPVYLLTFKAERKNLPCEYEVFFQLPRSNMQSGQRVDF